MVNELSASESDSEVDKEKENPLEDDHYGIVIEKEIYLWIIYAWNLFFALKSLVKIPHIYHTASNFSFFVV